MLAKRRADLRASVFVKLTVLTFNLTTSTVRFAEPGSASIFPIHDPFDDRRVAARRRFGAGQALLCRACTQRGRLPGKAGTSVPRAARSGRGGDRHTRLD